MDAGVARASIPILIIDVDSLEALMSTAVIVSILHQRAKRLLQQLAGYLIGPG